MAQYANELEALRLFNEKAARLASSRFYAAVCAGKNTFNFAALAGKGTTFVYDGPDQEAIEAMTLTVRFFTQNNEPISLWNMAKHYATLPLSPDIVGQFTKWRETLNAILDQPPVMNLNILGDKPTNRDICDTMIYGVLAHSNKAKRARYDAWCAAPMAREMIEYSFVSAIIAVIRGVIYIAEVNVAALAELQQQGIG